MAFTVKMTEKSLTGKLPFEPTRDQKTAIGHIAAFDSSAKPQPVYILKGYAGTGKTSLLSAYVKTLLQLRKRFVLLAPTGRAAKVLAKYTGMKAFTIHRQIYQVITSGEGYNSVVPAPNPYENTVFIIDEASMINDSGQGGDGLFNARNLLDDLITYIFSGEGNKMMLVGDTAQLPPVGLDISPALDPLYIKNGFNVTAFSFEMREVKRQSLDSGILYSATLLREKIRNSQPDLPYFEEKGFRNDIIRIDNGYDLEELLEQTFSGKDIENGIVICRSNKRANLFNRQVRTRILQYENEIEGGDYLMVVKNNYFWLDENSEAGFIANGDLIRLVRIVKIEEMYGYRFADAEIELLDYPGEKEVSVKLLLSTLDSEGPGLPEDDRKQLFANIEEDYMDIPERKKRMARIAKNPWHNALHIKFAYAMTCHKTQGGQWPSVIIDQGYLAPEMINTEYQRWLYTALTRSTEKVYLINFSEEFFG